MVELFKCYKNSKTISNKLPNFGSILIRNPPLKSFHTSVDGDADSELLLMELPWGFHEQNFGIQNSISLFDFISQKS